MTAEPTVPGPVPAPVDHRQLLAEIDAEVRRRREEGDYPPGFERELDALFDRFAPPSVSEDFDVVLERADQHAFVDVDVPVASRIPGGTLVKKVLRRLMVWFVQHVARQVTAFASTVVRAVRLLGRRVDRLEAAVPGSDPRVLDVAASLPRPDHSGWDRTVVGLLDRTPGRVAVADCGDARLLRGLVGAGIDAYGVEPRVDLADEAAAGGLEVRADDTLAHLRAVPEGALGGLVLVDVVERRPVGDLLELADLAASRLAPGGRLVLVSATPAGRADGAGPWVSDLAPFRPLHAATWERLLAERGLADLETRPGPAAGRLDPVPGDDPATEALNDRLARIDAALFGPASYVVTGVRPAP